MLQVGRAALRRQCAEQTTSRRRTTRNTSREQGAKRSQRPHFLGDSERPRRFRGDPVQFSNCLQRARRHDARRHRRHSRLWRRCRFPLQRCSRRFDVWFRGALPHVPSDSVPYCTLISVAATNGREPRKDRGKKVEHRRAVFDYISRCPERVRSQ